jgi:hypothetical protein
MFLHNLLNEVVQIANKMGLEIKKKNKQERLLEGRNWAWRLNSWTLIG